MSESQGQSRFGIVFAHQIDAPISDAAFRLFVRLTSYADKQGVCWPSVSTLAETSGVLPRQIHKLLRELVAAGMIVRQPAYRPDGSQRASTTFIPVRAEQERVSQQDRGEWASGTDLEQTIEQTKRTDHETSSPSGRGGQDGSVKIGNLSDDVSMPEAGAVPAKKEPVKTGTHGWAKAEFVRLMRAARVGQTGTTQGVLNRTFKKLREEGYTNEEIVSLVRTFFARYEQDIRAKRTEIDPSVMFVQRLPQLKAIKAEEIENKRAGGTTSVERGAELQREALKRLGLREDQSA